MVIEMKGEEGISGECLYNKKISNEKDEVGEIIMKNNWKILISWNK